MKKSTRSSGNSGTKPQELDLLTGKRVMTQKSNLPFQERINIAIAEYELGKSTGIKPKIFEIANKNQVDRNVFSEHLKRKINGDNVFLNNKHGRKPLLSENGIQQAIKKQHDLDLTGQSLKGTSVDFAPLLRNFITQDKLSELNVSSVSSLEFSASSSYRYMKKILPEVTVINQQRLDFANLKEDDAYHKIVDKMEEKLNKDEIRAIRYEESIHIDGVRQVARPVKRVECCNPLCCASRMKMKKGRVDNWIQCSCCTRLFCDDNTCIEMKNVHESVCSSLHNASKSNKNGSITNN